MDDNQNPLISVGDIVEITGKTLLSALPVGGTLISSVWDTIKANTANKRLQEWQSIIESRLSKIELSLENIGENESFTTAMFFATEAAIKTAESAKRDYLANAVLHSAHCELEESIMMMFFNMIQQYTLWHIKVLDFFKRPKRYQDQFTHSYSMGSPKDLLFDVYPELKSNEPVVDKIIKELYNDGLMTSDNLNVTMTAEGMSASRTTSLGSQFIQFITMDI